MRKVFSGILTAVLVLSLETATVFAAGPGAGRYYVDADGDGVCDYAGSACAYVDDDGDGICDTCGTIHGSCPNGAGTNFVDDDGDGICDNYGTGGCGRGRGYGRGCGRGFRGGRG